MPTSLLIRFGYPKVPGDQPESIVDVTGPTSYASVTVGIPPTGGQVVTAHDFGLQSFDYVVAMGSNNANYLVTVFPVTLPAAPSPPTPTQLPDGTFSAVVLMWNNAATGAQVTAGTNLSGAIVRLFARGH